VTAARRLLALSVALGAALTVGLAVLWGLAVAGVEATLAARHDDALRRVLGGLDRSLGALVAREEARPFLEYRYLYVPLDNANPAVVRSPLSRPPEEPAIQGFFTLEPDGTFRSPSTPRGNELGLVQAKGWAAGPGPDPQLEALVRALPLSEDRAPPPPPEPQGRQQAVQVVSTKRLNLDPFASDRNTFDPGAEAEQDVAVEVRPFRGIRRGDDLVLVREVVAEGRTYRQGLVVDLHRLAADVGAAVLAEEGLAGQVTLAWDGAPPEGRWTRDHAFAPPLQDLRVVAGTDELPGLVGPARGAVRGLGVLVLLVLVGGGAAVARGVHLELQAARRRTDFVSAVTHELKTPLTTIRMYAEMLRDGMVPEDRRAEYLTTLLSESDRLGRLVGNVLTLGQLEKGTVTPVLVVGDAAAVLAEALEVVRPHAARAGFALEVDAAPGLPPVRLDRDALIQVVVNLVDNAVKFAADGERRLTFTLRAEAGRVALAVRDRGPGVPDAHLAQVFEPFWRGERELVRRTKGTGIGLALVRGLVAGMGGAVEARNAPGGGLEVVVRLLTA
jgi:signal transduction histidine kinase